MAFADAQAFAQRLIIYHRLGEHSRIDGMLNAPGPGGLAALREAFPAIQTNVFRTTSPAELARFMIERQLPLAVTSSGNRTYLARLERMVQLAAQ